MQLETFLKHWGLSENPFTAEEAREDPVFGRLIDSTAAHTEFEKVLGQADRPGSAVVFGEKGSGKTAIRLMLERRLERYNAERTDGLVWVVRYDDLNGVLDRVAQRQPRYLSDADLLRHIRLEDHMDAILSLATTRFVSDLLDEGDGMLRGNAVKTARRLPKRQRVDLMWLAMLYDQPRSGNVLTRFERLGRVLRVGGGLLGGLGVWLGWLMVLLALAGAGVLWAMGGVELAEKVVVGMVGGGGVLLLGGGVWGWWRRWRLAGRLRGDVRAVERGRGQLGEMLRGFTGKALADLPMPVPGSHDSRYQLMGRLLDVMGGFGVGGMVVVIDRVDEPTLIGGDAERMRDVVWPLLNNKFLQQDRLGVKMLLPIELRALLMREGGEFYQRARLDKQHLVDRLVWSGHLLYDMCSRRIAACCEAGAEAIGLSDWFGEDVGREYLVEALDQMHQPRDAFKFIYRVLQAHCGAVSEDAPQWTIPRLTLDFVRKEQSQRVQELYRGLLPG